MILRMSKELGFCSRLYDDKIWTYVLDAFIDGMTNPGLLVRASFWRKKKNLMSKSWASFFITLILDISAFCYHLICEVALSHLPNSHVYMD